MKISFLPEPELDFGSGLPHVDIRFGLLNYGPLDVDWPEARKNIRVGVVGIQKSIAGFQEWLEKCKAGIHAKESRKPNLFPRYPGVSDGTHFKPEFTLDTRFLRSVNERDLERIAINTNRDSRVRELATAFDSEIEYLASKKQVDVIVCALPFSVCEMQEDGVDEKSFSLKVRRIRQRLKIDFHDLLKAMSMKHGIPIQIGLPTTFGEKAPKKLKERRERTVQDEATRAWNFHVALYYKSGGTPWRLRRESSIPSACYVGVSFFESLDRSELTTSIAQVFNELGEGVILRGAKAQLSKDDRTPHLSEEDASKLLLDALGVYRKEHHTLPARVVVHKTSKINEQELRGFRSAADNLKIEYLDCLSVVPTTTRLFRHGAYPPLRGTLLSLDDNNHVLYTRGSVDFFETYPGMYVPKPLGLNFVDVQRDPKEVASEILGLTKMNWNKTQFDSRDPITVHAARQVGSIMRYLKSDDHYESRYGFYM